MKLVQFLGLDKFINLFRMVKHHGGLIGTVSNIFRTDQLKVGRLVGTDYFGNSYFENNEYSFPRNRWMEYNRSRWLDYDATQIPPEWHRWLHQMTDHPPTTHPPEDRKWILPQEENFSGDLKRMYMPYSTTRTKIEAWTPSGKSARRSTTI